MRICGPAFLLTLVLLPVWLTATVPAENLRIATYNLQNYLSTDRMVEGQWHSSYPKPESEKKVLRRNLLSVRPDLLALQEIGGLPYLRELQMDLSDAGLEYPFFAHMESVDGERNIAVLSRLPIQSIVQHSDLEFPYFDEIETVNRGMLEVRLSVTAAHREKVLKVFVVHLKSRYTSNKADPQSEKRRVKEAEACRNRILKGINRDGEGLYCILGDFNDYPGSAAVRRFCRKGNFLIGNYIRAEDDRGELWTYFWKKQSQYSTVDGFIVSPALFPFISGGQGHIHSSPKGQKGSDHRLVYLDFAWRGTGGRDENGKN